MKISLFAQGLLMVVMVAACDRTREAENPATASVASAETESPQMQDSANPTASANDAVATAAPNSDDALALGLLAAVNQYEIDAALQAQSKQLSVPVMDFARMMEKDHSDNLAKTKALGSPADTAEVQAMREKAKSDLAELGKKSGKEYETAYVEAMVQGHTETLALIDGRLLSLASVGPVKDHLNATRERVAAHLEAVRKLQDTE